MTLFLPAEKEGHVEEGGEVGEELEGEHLDGEALLRGSERSRLLYLRDTSGSEFRGGSDLRFPTGSNISSSTERTQARVLPDYRKQLSIPLRQRLSVNLLLVVCLFCGRLTYFLSDHLLPFLSERTAANVQLPGHEKKS